MKKRPFDLVSPFAPAGDQPKAIAQLTKNFRAGSKRELLLGATGTGKTFVMANIIKELKLPTLVLAHNKTLAGQLYGEFKQFFPQNRVGYFISYYDYYQPEAYLPSSDTYIEKDSSRNDDIDRMRHFATSQLLEGNDCVIVASVSCIYGIGSPESYREMSVELHRGMELPLDRLCRQLTDIQYERTQFDLSRGKFRVNGDIVEIHPAYEEKYVVRLEYFGDTVEEVLIVDPLEGRRIRSLDTVKIYPKSHYVAEQETMARAITGIRAEMEQQEEQFKKRNKLIEAQRIRERTENDLALMESVGFCSGIENYSRYLTGRAPGEPPPTLVDYFGKDFLLIVDESHVTLPQVHGMFNGDRARKEVLVEYGFRLPSALDNRPLHFDEFTQRWDRVLFASATPREYEIGLVSQVTELINRPTGLLDPVLDLRPAREEVPALFDEIVKETRAGGKVLVTALTKKMAEDLTDFLNERGVRARYLHSDIDAMERLKIVMDLRRGLFDVLVGVNLLREGLDIPEVTLVGILDADKEGFLRSGDSLIQTIGRAARNLNGRAILFADKVTDGMKKAIDETRRRRRIQEDFNTAHGITPRGILNKAILDIEEHVPGKGKKPLKKLARKELARRIAELESEMKRAAESWDFEYAAILRDRIFEYKGLLGEE
ncbi:MAG TPA: excinuclease ABC subunit UvrB [bacterium]|nr:excinuclease ABC subunit UvrB [bacterium]